jgi:hypothetical protein
MAEKFALKLANKLAIVRLADTEQPLLVRLKQRRNNLSGILQNNSTGVAPDELPIQPDEILSVFPHNRPMFGKSYNIYVEPWVKQERLPHWGLINYYRNLTDTETTNLHKGLQLTYRRLIRKYNLKYLLPMNLEIRNPRGKQIGMYHAPKKSREAFTEISPISFIGSDTLSGAKYIMRIVAHEMGHPCFQLYLSDRYKVRWVQLYHSFNKITTLTLDDLSSMRQSLIRGGATVQQYRKELDEDARLAFDTVMLWIKKVGRIDARFLNILINQQDDLRSYWPHSKIHLSELQVAVTKYATKNPEEFFCESLALLTLREGLPKTVIKLLTRSLRSVQPK